MAKILLTGSTGYIGRRLLDHLLDSGHELICPVRDKRRFDFEDFTEDQLNNITVVEVDFGTGSGIENLPVKIDAAYYLIHSMSSNTDDFRQHESLTATNFSNYLRQTSARHCIYLSGIVNDDDLSEHLSSRLDVENILSTSGTPLTTLRAGIIIGSGSASFEIIRDLVEKLPVMVAPKWLQSRSQPIAVGNVMEYLQKALFNEQCYNRSFDIGGADVLTYKEMLLGYARVRGLKRGILVVPVLTPRLSSLWLYFVTSTSFSLARNLVDSMKNEVVAKDNLIDDIIPLDKKYNYEEAIQRTLDRLETSGAISSWKDSVESEFNTVFLGQKEAPKFGVLKDKRSVEIDQPAEKVLDNIWSIGGDKGWYYGSWLWQLRGIMDKVVGGVGLRRGRRHPTDLKTGDALDFWRVLYADRSSQRLLLFAEMKLPGDAWLEFRVKKDNGNSQLIQTAVFRPKGLAGRIYWWIVSPFHLLIFRGMARQIASK